MRIFLLFIIGLVISNNLIAQVLKDHRWENRVVVIQAKDASSANYQKQLEEFVNSVEEFEERRIVLYQIVNQKYKYTDFKKPSLESVWKPFLKWDELKVNPDEIFKIELVGLDGGIKLESKQVVLKEDLFKLIDSMPMRKYELKKNR